MVSDGIAVPTTHGLTNILDAPSTVSSFWVVVRYSPLEILVVGYFSNAPRVAKRLLRSLPVSRNNAAGRAPRLLGGRILDKALNIAWSSARDMEFWIASLNPFTFFSYST
jgi:hypothetical protein